MTSDQQLYATPAPPPGPRPATGRALLSASWQMLRKDSELVWLPALGAVAGLVAAAILFVPGWALGNALDVGGTHRWAVGLGGFLAALGASFVGIFFQAALVIGANERADGGDPTFRGTIAAAWTHRARIFSWALLTTTVGVAIRAVERRLGLVGNIIGFLSGLAWAIASFLVVPVLVAENLGPIDAVKRSAHLIKTTWGTSLRTTLRFGFIQFVLIVPALILLVAGIAMLTDDSSADRVAGALLAAVGGVAIVAMSLVFSAIGSYARALIYRYATGRPVPGIDPALFTGVFQPKR